MERYKVTETYVKLEHTLCRISQSGMNKKLLYVSTLTSISRGRRVTLCMGRMRKEIMERFRQSGWASILVSTSLNAGFVDLKGRLGIKKTDQLMIHRESEEKMWRGRRANSLVQSVRTVMLDQIHERYDKNICLCVFARSLTPASAEFSAGRPHWSSMWCKDQSWTEHACTRCRWCRRSRCSAGVVLPVP